MHAKKLELKKIRKEDLRSIIKWRNDSEIMKYNTQYFLLNMEYEEKWYGDIIKKDSKNKTRIHGKGFGTKALQMLIDYGFFKMKLHRIGADIFEYNKISVKLFEKLGFTKEGVLNDYLWRSGKWWNLYKYSIIN